MRAETEALMREIINCSEWCKADGTADEDKCPDINIYKEIIKYQKDVYDNDTKSGRQFSNEGFVVPQPWNGDLENAKVLFLGSNPGFTPGAFCPRSFGDGRFRWFGTQCIDSKDVSINDVMNFFNQRFQDENFSVVTDKGKFSVKMDNRPYKKRGVPYWNGIFEFLKQLYDEKPRNGELVTNKSFVRRVMKKCVSTEIVPFASINESLLTPELLDYCWKKFSSRILELSGASLIVLVGNKARERFLNLYNAPLNLGADLRGAKIISIPHFSYWGNHQGGLPTPDFSLLRKFV